MRISLELIVIAIIILIVAVVALTIFGGGIGQFGSATDARSNCLNQGKWSCETSGTLPAGWEVIPVLKQGGQEDWKTCYQLVGEMDCCKPVKDDNSIIVGWEWKCEAGTSDE